MHHGTSIVGTSSVKTGGVGVSSIMPKTTNSSSVGVGSGGDGGCLNSINNNKASSRSVYLSLSNVPKGKTYRNFPTAVTPVTISATSGSTSSSVTTTSRILPPPLLSPTSTSSSAATTSSVKLISSSACRACIDNILSFYTYIFLYILYIIFFECSFARFII